MFLYSHQCICIAGLYVLSSEPVKIPWFDFVFADIGDEQSLSQSLSTFSGHLKQTSVCHLNISHVCVYIAYDLQHHGVDPLSFK